MRYDPIWRRIKPDKFTTKLEGRFPARTQRLDGLNNWGVLSWIYPHASATKLAHHYGLERNAMQFLDASNDLAADRAKYGASFRTASHVLHWGHLPLSYATEEAVLRAAHVDPKAQKVVSRILEDVTKAGSLTCDKDGHDCLAVIRTGDRPFELYRWLSAWLVQRNWPALWKAVKDAAQTTPDKDETKRDLIRALVCRQHRGYRIVSRCNQADYVPRDLLQAGTASLTFDIEALWEPNPLGSDAAREWSLIEGAQEYLDARFFHASESLLVHSLAARAVAAALLADDFSAQTLLDLLECGDDALPARFKPYHRTRFNEIAGPARSGRLPDHWTHIGPFTSVSLPDGSIFEMEDLLSGRSGSGRVTYPFTSNYLVGVSLEDSSLPELFAGPGRRYATVDLYHREGTGDAGSKVRGALGVLKPISVRSNPGSAFGDTVMSWLLEGTVEQHDEAIGEACGRAGREISRDVQQLTRKILALDAMKPVLGHALVNTFFGALADGTESLYGSLLLRMPWVGLKTANGQKLMTRLRDAALAQAASGKKSERGYALEVAVAADQWLADGAPTDRFVFLGSTLLGKDNQPAHEWDVVRIDLQKTGWTVTAIECAISRTEAKDGEARDKLELLRQRLQNRFADLTSYATDLATVTSGRLSYEDAGRSFAV